MEKIEDYDFQNFFEVIGIEKYDDIEYLKSEIEELKLKLKDAIIRNPTRSTDEDNEELEKEYDHFIKNIGCFDKENSAYSVLDYISQIVNLKYFMSLFDKGISSKEKNLASLAYRQLRTPEDVEKYISKKLLPLERIDCENRNLNNLKDSRKDCMCGLKKHTTPQLKLGYKTEDGETIKVYETGTFAYKSLKRPDGTYAKGSDGYSILTVLKNDSSGNLKTYNGVMRLNEYVGNDPEFYANVVFSDLNMRNAMHNNYGYIGSVCIQNGNRCLEYKEIDIDELISALYTASTEKNRTISTGINGSKNETLFEFYEDTNELVKSEEYANLER